MNTSQHIVSAWVAAARPKALPLADEQTIGTPALADATRITEFPHVMRTGGQGMPAICLSCFLRAPVVRRQTASSPAS